MSWSDIPCLSLAVTRLTTTGSAHFAFWVLTAPFPGGYVHHDRTWPKLLTQSWIAWQELFSPSTITDLPFVAHESLERLTPESLQEEAAAEQVNSYSGRLMQHLGIHLWEWLFDGAIHSSLSQSQGIAIGKTKPLRLRLEIRDPDLVPLPWEIVQPQAGKPAIALNQQLLFSRTTSDVDPLPPLRMGQSLKILLVLGQNEDLTTPNEPDSSNPLERKQSDDAYLALEQEAATLAQKLETSGQTRLPGSMGVPTVPSQVDMLLQPTPAELIDCLETGTYNIFFYAGHGIPGPDGGMLFLRPDATLNGTELAQVLTRCRVTLAVFNACWGAQSAQNDGQAIPRSSLAEVLIHHGVPAVLGMRDSIADREALSFMEAFSQALAERLPIDRAVAVARQQLLTLYKFNQPAWTLPVLYMHPQFDGQLIRMPERNITELPTNSPTWMERPLPSASLRTLEDETAKNWPIRGGLMRVGRSADNDIVIQERWVSQRHAEIFCRDSFRGEDGGPTYFLRDFSRYGTLIWRTDGWQRVHHREFPLNSGVKLKFGSSQGQTLEFVIEDPEPLPTP